MHRIDPVDWVDKIGRIDNERRPTMLGSWSARSSTCISRMHSASSVEVSVKLGRVGV